jgi:hypothetical protein
VTSRAGYWFGAALIVFAAGAAILWLVLSFVSIASTLDDFVRVPAPGSERVALEPRKYVVYLEGPGAGRDFTPPVRFAIVDAEGRPLPTAGYSGSLTYSIGGHDGTATATVTPPRAGTYQLRVLTTADPSAGYGLALGQSIGGRILRAILGTFAIGGLLLVAGIGLIVVTAVRRRKQPPGAGASPPSPGIAGLEG